MELKNIFLVILPFLGLLLLMIAWYRQKYHKNDTTEEVVKPSKLKKMFLKSSIYKIFFYRASLRPSSWFFYWLFVFPSFLVMFAALIVFITKPPIKLKDMQQATGKITKIKWIKAGKARSYIGFIDKNGSEAFYYVSLNEERFNWLNSIDSDVTIYLYDEYHFHFFGLYEALSIEEIKDKSNSLYKYNYEKRMNWYIKNRNFFYDTWFGLKIMLVGLFFIFLLNYEELPIHRLNRMRKYLKNKQKKEK
jgi:hypothetical protein